MQSNSHCMQLNSHCMQALEQLSAEHEDVCRSAGELRSQLLLQKQEMEQTRTLACMR